MLAPIIAAVKAGDERTASAQVADVTRTLEEMLMAEESGFPELR